MNIKERLKSMKQPCIFCNKECLGESIHKMIWTSPTTGILPGEDFKLNVVITEDEKLHLIDMSTAYISKISESDNIDIPYEYEVEYTMDFRPED